MHRRRGEHRILRRVQDLGVQPDRSVEAAQVLRLVEEDAADRNLLAEIDHDPVIAGIGRVEVRRQVPVDQSRQRSAVVDSVAGRHRLPRRRVAVHVPGRVNDHLVEVKEVVDDEFDVTTDGSGRFVLLRQPSARRDVGEMFSILKLSLATERLSRGCRRLDAGGDAGGVRGGRGGRSRHEHQRQKREDDTRRDRRPSV